MFILFINGEMIFFICIVNVYGDGIFLIVFLIWIFNFFFWELFVCKNFSVGIFFIKRIIIFFISSNYNKNINFFKYEYILKKKMFYFKF